MPETPLVKRALELAATGRFGKVTEIRLALRAEGYGQADPHLQGAGIRRQLRALMSAAKAPDQPAQDAGVER